MPYKDGIPKINCYSLTDFNDFEACAFRFFIRHHLDRKYEIDESSPQVALGNLLDQSIKKFHKFNFYGCDVVQLEGLVRAAARNMREEVEDSKEKGKNHFYAATIPFLTAEVVNQAIEIFQNYYQKKERKIRKALGEVGFCEFVIKTDTGVFKLWGGPDTLELGDDGLPEVVDYKSRMDIEKGKANLDIELMSKIYVLLCSQKLLSKGYTKTRFVIRFWQDPFDDNFNEEFDLAAMNSEEFLFRQKIEKIMQATEVKLCGNKYCAACKSDKKDEFLKALEQKGLIIVRGDEFQREQEKSENFLPF